MLFSGCISSRVFWRLLRRFLWFLLLVILGVQGFHYRDQGDSYKVLRTLSKFQVFLSRVYFDKNLCRFPLGASGILARLITVFDKV